MRTRKQLAAALNKINNRNDIEIKKDGDTYVVAIGGYESAIWGYGLKDLVNELKHLQVIKMVYRNWTMQGIKTMEIKSL